MIFNEVGFLPVVSDIPRDRIPVHECPLCGALVSWRGIARHEGFHLERADQ